MPDLRISQLTVASSIGSTDVLPLVQGGVTKGATAETIGLNGCRPQNNFWTDDSPAAWVEKIPDRLQVGAAADTTGAQSGAQGSWLSTSADGANWAPRDSQFISMARTGLIAVTGASRSGDQEDPAHTACIGVAGFVINNKVGGQAWALYADVQHEADATGSLAIEIAVKNKGADFTSTPYNAVSGAAGIWMPAGGDSSYGGAPTNPNNYAIGIGAGASTWNKGIIFFGDGLTRDGSGYAVPIEMGEKHVVQWRTSSNTIGFGIRSEVTTAASDVSLVASDNTLTMYGTGGVALATFAHTASAVNSIRVQNATTGTPVTVRFLGGDTNVGGRFRTKGTGAFYFASQDSTTNDEFRIGGVNSAPVNYLHAYGTNSGSGIGIIEANGTDTNVDAILQGKGNRGGRLRDGAAANKFQWDTTGIAFFAGTTAAKQTITGSRANPEQALASLLTALSASYGLVTDSTTA